MIEIKGTSVRGTYEFVKKNFPTQFDTWINELPEDSRNIMGNLILTNKWYPIQEGLILPINTISHLFFNGDNKYTAFFMGSYHAEISLTGIYKFFIRLNSPKFIIERGLEVLNTYFRPSKFEIEIRNDNSVIIYIFAYVNPNIIIESSIEGWTRRAIEISGGKNVQSQILKSLTLNDDITEIVLSWD